MFVVGAVVCVWRARIGSRLASLVAYWAYGAYSLRRLVRVNRALLGAEEAGD